MIKNAIYKVRENYCWDYNLIKSDKVIVLGKDLYQTIQRVKPPEKGFENEKKVTEYRYAYTYESWYGDRRTIEELPEIEFTDSIYSSYDFVGFVGEEL
jgi:hypothetical protein